MQALVNGRLIKHVLTPFRAMAITFGGGALVLGLATPIAVAVQGPLHLSGGAAWMWLGGTCGVLIVVSNTLGVPKIGAAAFMSIFVSSQMSVAFVYDATGAFGFEQVT
jgi:uncharacterized membrane protein YdcZ (DUF606 family)